jgi:hypothetical protein
LEQVIADFNALLASKRFFKHFPHKITLMKGAGNMVMTTVLPTFLEQLGKNPLSQ